MYNIALCFYGEARNWSHGGQSIANFRNLCSNTFNIDIYCHLWNDITRRTKNIKDAIKNKKDIKELCIVSKNLKHQDLLKLYAPVEYIIEDKSVLDLYIDKFKPTDKDMSVNDFKLAIKYSNTPCFSQLYSTWQSYNVIKNKNKYDLILLMRTDCVFDNKSVTSKHISYFCEKIKINNSLFVERMSFVPKKNEPWLYTGYMLGNSVVFNSLFEDFPKIPIGMGQYKRDVYSYRGEMHAEIANYILNYTDINRVWPILVRSHPKFIGKYTQFDIEKIK